MKESAFGKGDLLIPGSDRSSVQRAAQAGKERLSVAVLVAAVVAVGAAALFVKLAQAPVLTIAFWRLALSALVLAPLARREGTTLRDLLSDAGGLALAGFLLAVHFASWFWSLRLTSVLASTVLVSSYPLVLYALERRLGEDLGGRLGPILMALLGVAVLSVGGGTSQASLAGAGLAALGALAMAGYLLVGRRVRQRLGVFGYASAVYGAAAAVLLLAALATGARLVGFDPRTNLMIALLVLGPTVVGHTGFNYALRYWNATTVGVVQLGEPVVAAALAFAVLGQRPGWAAVVGSCLVLAGIAWFARARGSGVYSG
jgi:drug/metabolite transporter (DMT)-like permease